MPDAIIAGLATLGLSGIEIGDFSTGRLTYTAMADTNATATTVEAIATQEAATVVIAPTDADAENGHQVALAAETEIVVTVTSGDGSRIKSYRIRVEKPPCLPGLSAERLSEVTFVGGSVDDLDRCAREQNVAAFFYWTGQSWLLLAPDAPDFLSREFRDSFIAGVPTGASFIAAIYGRQQHRQLELKRPGDVRMVRLRSSAGMSLPHSDLIGKRAPCNLTPEHNGVAPPPPPHDYRSRIRAHGSTRRSMGTL